MGFKHTTGGDTAVGGKKLSEAGTFHLAIVGIQDPPTNPKDGSIISGGAFRVDFDVLAGTNDSQKGKPADIVFFHMKGTEKDGGKLTKKKIDRFFLATGLATQQQLEVEGNQLDINLNDAVGRQIVAQFDKDQNDPRFVQLAWANIYHVDDPAVKDVPKDVEALRMIPAALRWPGGKPAARATGTGNRAKPPTHPAPTAAGAVKQPVTSFDGI